ncbi:outer membrane lipoprotein LolB [Lysobacteraceae bacterium NML120232]|nr:outer membrane lipoprotein LolB [Xanthomonadaceae bacterium NML120232]
MRQVALIAALLLGVVACAGRQARPEKPAHVCAAAGQDEICARLVAALPTGVDGAWQMLGRVAVASGSNSGNARLEWQQQGARDYQVVLSAPLTRQSWRLVVRPDAAVIHGLPEGARQGGDAARLLHEVSGWQIPLESLPYWLRGRPAPERLPEQYRFDAEGRLIGLLQNGWNIEFSHGAQWPARISASRGENRVRLVVDTWSEGNE